MCGAERRCLFTKHPPIDRARWRRRRSNDRGRAALSRILLLQSVEHLEAKYGDLSGGERQMLAVGRALMCDPQLLMLDEPSLGLAPAIVEGMYETLMQLHKGGLTILLAEQSVELALEVSDFAYVLQVGRNALSGESSKLANDPNVQKVYLGL